MEFLDYQEIEISQKLRADAAKDAVSKTNIVEKVASKLGFDVIDLKMKSTMRQQVVVISNNETYFFSTDHCQDHGMGDDYVPCTHTLPSCVTPRESVPDGIVKNVEDLVSVFYYDMVEIPNPDTNMQPNL